MSRPRRRTAGPTAISLVLAVVLAACGQTTPPIPTSVPSPTRPPVTPRPSQGAFVPAAYPVSGAAPCDEAKPPDATHSAYRGNLKRIRATSATKVVFELCEPDVAFLTKLADPAFAINDADWLRSHIVPDGSVSQAIAGEVNGTGPYRLESWQHGSEISLARNDAYWGPHAQNERVIVRWNDSSAARVTALQDGTVDGIDRIDATGTATVADDVSLALQPRPGMDIVYLGFNTADPVFGQEDLRQAIAIGLDRQRMLDAGMASGAELASHYAPCAVLHACGGGEWPTDDATMARELVGAAGFPDGFDTTIHYSATPTAALPDPAAVATELQRQLLDDLGIRAKLAAEPDATYRADVDAGKVGGIHLIDRSVPYPDVTAYLEPRFGAGSAEFGKPFDDVVKALADGRASTAAAKRDAAYAKVNDLLRVHVPMIPLGRAGTATAYLVDVTGAVASPLGLERFAAMTPGDRRQMVWMTDSEPGGLYCADRTDDVARLVCSQLLEGLYGFDPGGAVAAPALATGCAPNEELTVWTCTLRDDAQYHDGSRLDANDVVLSFAAQWDADHPLHRGGEGQFATFASWFGGFLNPPSG